MQKKMMQVCRLFARVIIYTIAGPIKFNSHDIFTIFIGELLKRIAKVVVDNEHQRELGKF